MRLPRSQSVQALRGLASLAVAWFHLTNQHTSIVFNSGSLGWLGVEAFFVISGFVIPLSLHQSAEPYRARDFPRFMLRRVVRIEPPYLVSVALVVALLAVSSFVPGFNGPPFAIDWGQLAAHVAYLVPLTDYEWLQVVYWTLAYEFVFYLFVGLCFALIDGDRKLWFGVVLAMALFVAIEASPLWLLFVIGVATYRYMTGLDGVVAAVAACAIAALAMVWRDFALQAGVGLATALAIALGYRLPLRGWAGRLLVGLGTISYSLYLLHVPLGGRVINLGQRFVGESWGAELLLSLTALAVALAASCVFYFAVEKPAIAASRRIDQRARG